MNTALFTRFTRRRNFAGFPFWVSSAPETCAALAARARDYAATQGFAAGLHLADCAPAALGVFRERQMLPERPVSFEGKRDFKMLFPGASDGEHALFGEVEHWTRVRVVPGLPEPGAESAGLLASPENEAAFSRSATYGFLTSNPAFAGPGLQMEAGLHLPALAAHRRIPGVQQALGALGFDLQPLTLRAPGSAESGYFRLLSRGGMNLSVETLYGDFAARATTVLAAESGALESWHLREPNRLEDRVHRALRLLQEARRMDYAEFLSLTSFARIGVYLGLFPGILRESLETLRVGTQPFHLRTQYPQAENEEADKLRADACRQALAGVRPLS